MNLNIKACRLFKKVCVLSVLVQVMPYVSEKFNIMSSSNNLILIFWLLKVYVISIVRWIFSALDKEEILMKQGMFLQQFCAAWALEWFLNIYFNQ